MKNHFAAEVLSFLKIQKKRIEEKGMIPTIDLLIEEIEELNLCLNADEEEDAKNTITQEMIDREESDRYDLSTCHK